MTEPQFRKVISSSEAIEDGGPCTRTDPPEHHRRDSKIGRAIDYIRHAIAHEHDRGVQTPAPPRSKSGQRPTAANDRDSISPALEAAASSHLNQNNMEQEAVQIDEAWGWPGLGSISNKQIKTSKTKTQKNHLESSDVLESRMEAATFEAIDNSAESETYGWPGLGTWESTKT